MTSSSEGSYVGEALTTITMIVDRRRGRLWQNDTLLRAILLSNNADIAKEWRQDTLGEKLCPVQHRNSSGSGMCY